MLGFQCGLEMPVCLLTCRFRKVTARLVGDMRARYSNGICV